jgi:hydrogenase maturation protease
MENTKDTIVIGLGNPLMGDEGIGVVLIEKLEALARQGKIPGADRIRFHDGGVGGMNLLHAIAGKKRAILIDCALMETEPGTIRRFTPDQVRTVKKLSHLSLHEVDILKVLELARQLGECPEQIVFFGIQPREIAQRMDLSDTLKYQIDRYIQTILKEINQTF